MQDERSRRFRAKIDLNTGRATIRETEAPPGPRADAPSVVHQAAAGGGPSGPAFPWARQPDADLPQPQDAVRHGFPTPSHTATPAPQAHSDASTSPAPSAVAPDLVESVSDAVVERMRDLLGFPPEEPPVPVLMPHEQAGFNPAGAFVDTGARTASPAGAFATKSGAPNPAGAFAQSA